MFDTFDDFEDESPEEKLRRQLEESMSASGKQTGQDFATPYDEPVEPVSSADAVRRKAEAAQIDPVERTSQESLDRYADWSRRRPQEDDPATKPSLGRNILAGIVGALAGINNPEQGGRIAAGISGQKHDEAERKWREEGDTLKEVTPLFAAEETRRLSERGQDITQRGQDVGFEETDIRERGAESRFIRNEEGEERRSKRSAETAAAGETAANTRAAGVQAGANTRAGAREAGANTRAAARAAKAKEGIPLSPTAIRNAQSMSKADIYNDHPEWRKFFTEEQDSNGRIRRSIAPDPEAEDNWLRADKPAGWGADKAEHEKFKLELAKREHEYTTRRRTAEDNEVEPMYNFDED